MPMYEGLHPAKEYPTISASGFTPLFFASSRVRTQKEEAPSEMLQLFPAWTVPPFTKNALSGYKERYCLVRAWFMPSSCATLFPPASRATIWDLNRSEEHTSELQS